MLQNGCCIWFTGLSGAGKTTLAEILEQRLMEAGRTVTMLDGDIVRRHLSKGLGFSQEDREMNLLRIAFVAREIVRHKGLVIVAAITPYQSIRHKIRESFHGLPLNFAWVNTPLAVCEERDPKGLYKRARAGEIPNFTGIDDPFEPHSDAEIILHTQDIDAQTAIDDLIKKLG